MDLIAGLTEKLGIDTNQAQSLAGSLMQGIQGQVRQSAGPAEAEKFAAQVPEASEWANSAVQLDAAPAKEGGSLLGGMGVGDVLGAIGGKGEGGFDLGSLAQIFGKLNLDVGKIATVAPLVLSFLKSKLPANSMEQITNAVPLLKGGGASGGLSGGLGSLFS